MPSEKSALGASLLVTSNLLLLPPLCAFVVFIEVGRKSGWPDLQKEGEHFGSPGFALGCLDHFYYPLRLDRDVGILHVVPDA